MTKFIALGRTANGSLVPLSVDSTGRLAVLNHEGGAVLKLDQTTPQDIINGRPNFLAGIDVGSTGQLGIDASGNLTTAGNVGIGTTAPYSKLCVFANDDTDSNYITIGGTEDKTRGFEIDSGDDWKWANYIYGGEDGNFQYFASGNSGRDILVLCGGGRVGVNIPTLIGNIEILRFVQTGSNTYATVTCEVPHKLANNTPIVIEGATTEKFNGNFTITNVTTMSFRINGLEVGATTEDPTDAQVVMDTAIPATLAVFPQYLDDVYAFDKGADTGAGTGYTNITAEMRTSFGTAQIVATTAGSYLYLGKENPWQNIAINIATSSAGSSAIVVEYSTESGWTTLTTSTTSGNSLVDGTSRLTKDGAITWNLKSFKHLWKTQSIQVNPAPKYTHELYWIRISLTGTVTTAPTANSISNQGVDRLAVYAQASDQNPTMAVDYLGRIGFTPPELESKYRLGSLAGLTTSKFEVVAEDGARSDFIYYLANDTAGAHPAVIMARSGGTIASKTAVTSGMDVGALYGYGYDGATFREVGKILFESAKLATSGDASGRISFWTRNATSASAERMRITETGKVGIGTTAPKSTLQVNGGIQCANDTDTASADKVGTFRYRADANNSYCDMCMQTGASTYAWVNIVQNSW